MMLSAGLPIAVFGLDFDVRIIRNAASEFGCHRFGFGLSDRVEVVGAVQRSLQPRRFGQRAENRQGRCVAGGEVTNVSNRRGIVPIRRVD